MLLVNWNGMKLKILGRIRTRGEWSMLITWLKVYQDNLLMDASLWYVFVVISSSTKIEGKISLKYRGLFGNPFDVTPAPALDSINAIDTLNSFLKKFDRLGAFTHFFIFIWNLRISNFVKINEAIIVVYLDPPPKVIWTPRLIFLKNIITLQFNRVEDSMRSRREEVMAQLSGPNETIICFSAFPRIGCPGFTEPILEVSLFS